MLGEDDRPSYWCRCPSKRASELAGEPMRTSHLPLGGQVVNFRLPLLVSHVFRCLANIFVSTLISSSSVEGASPKSSWKLRSPPSALIGKRIRLVFIASSYHSGVLRAYKKCRNHTSCAAPTKSAWASSIRPALNLCCRCTLVSFIVFANSSKNSVRPSPSLPDLEIASRSHR